MSKIIFRAIPRLFVQLGALDVAFLKARHNPKLVRKLITVHGETKPYQRWAWVLPEEANSQKITIAQGDLFDGDPYSNESVHTTTAKETGAKQPRQEADNEELREAGLTKINGELFTLPGGPKSERGRKLRQKIEVDNYSKRYGSNIRDFLQYLDEFPKKMPNKKIMIQIPGERKSAKIQYVFDPAQKKIINSENKEVITDAEYKDLLRQVGRGNAELVRFGEPDYKLRIAGDTHYAFAKINFPQYSSTAKEEQEKVENDILADKSFYEKAYSKDTNAGDAKPKHAKDFIMQSFRVYINDKPMKIGYDYSDENDKLDASDVHGMDVSETDATKILDAMEELENTPNIDSISFGPYRIEKYTKKEGGVRTQKTDARHLDANGKKLPFEDTTFEGRKTIGPPKNTDETVRDILDMDSARMSNYAGSRKYDDIDKFRLAAAKWAYENDKVGRSDEVVKEYVAAMNKKNQSARESSTESTSVGGDGIRKMSVRDFFDIVPPDRFADNIAEHEDIVKRLKEDASAWADKNKANGNPDHIILDYLTAPEGKNWKSYLARLGRYVM